MAKSVPKRGVPIKCGTSENVTCPFKLISFASKVIYPVVELTIILLAFVNLKLSELISNLAELFILIVFPFIFSCPFTNPLLDTYGVVHTGDVPFDIIICPEFPTFKS